MSTPFALDGRRALVTGGGGRLGAAFTRALADAGAHVVVAGRRETPLAALADDLGHDRVSIAVVDLADEASIAALFDRLAQDAGRLDILVNNAATASDSPLGTLGADDLHAVFAINVVAATLCAQRAAPLMRSKGGGKIVNIGSIYGTVAPDPRLYEGVEMVRCSPPYVASKAALVTVTRDLAVRLAPMNIQVNMISPGGVEADQPAEFKRRYAERTPAGRMATPEDIAGAVVFLASPAADYVTGQNLHVDGGFTIW